MKALVYILTLVILISGCNKSKNISNKLDDDKWKVVELSVNGVNVSQLPTLKFKECDIYNENCEGTWYLGEEGHAGFIWQVREKGKTFEISNQADHTHSVEDVYAAQQCIDFSGVYNITKAKRKTFEAKSTTTYKYPGQTVVLKMEKL